MPSSEPDSSYYPLRVAVGFVLIPLVTIPFRSLFSYTAHPGLWHGPRWFLPLPVLISAALVGAVCGFVIDGTGNTAGAFAAGLVGSRFVSLHLPRLVFGVFPGRWSVFGRSGWIISVFVIPTLAYGAIGLIAAILSTRYRRFILGLTVAFLIAAAPYGLISAFLTHPISVPGPPPSFFQGRFFAHAMGFIQLFLAGLGTGFVLRDAHADLSRS